jgi:hypothetical protein
MTGFSALRPSTDVTITNSGAVLLTGISFTSMQAGDILDIRAVLRMQRITTDSSLTMYIEVVGPNGTSTLDERIIYADASVTSNLDHTMSGAWFYTCNQGDGTYTVRLSGYAFVSNVWKLLATDTDSGIYAASYSMR